MEHTEPTEHPTLDRPRGLDKLLGYVTERLEQPAGDASIPDPLGALAGSAEQLPTVGHWPGNDPTAPPVLGPLPAKWTRPSATELDTLRLAISDPGAFLPRLKIRDDEYESIPAWSARAVQTLVDPAMDVAHRAGVEEGRRLEQGEFHRYDPESTASPDGKPWPLWAGTEPMEPPDPLCRCGAFWFDNDGGCQWLAENRAAMVYQEVSSEQLYDRLVGQLAAVTMPTWRRRPAGQLAAEHRAQVALFTDAIRRLGQYEGTSATTESYEAAAVEARRQAADDLTDFQSVRLGGRRLPPLDDQAATGPQIAHPAPGPHLDGNPPVDDTSAGTPEVGQGEGR